MSNYLQFLQRRFSRIKRRKHSGSIVLEATVLVPFLLMIVVSLMTFQHYFFQQYQLQKALDASLGLLSSRLNMLIALEESSAKSLHWAIDGSQAMGMDVLDGQERLLLLEPFFRGAVLSAYFEKIYLERCRDLGINSSCSLVVEKDALVAYATLKTNMPQLVMSQFSVPTYKARMLCMDVQEFISRSHSTTVQVYLTPHGISESGKFHTHKCWSLIRAKKVISVQLTHIPKGFPLSMQWQGKSYQLCGFCYQEKFGKHSSH